MRGEGGIDRDHYAEHEMEAKTMEDRGERKEEMGTLVTSLEPLNPMT